MNHYLVYLIPFLAAGIGWLTNFAAIKMLFYPRRAIDLKIFTLHGVFPRRKKDIAKTLGEVIADEILSGSAVASQLNDHNNIEKINNLVGDRVEQRLRQRTSDGSIVIKTILTDNIISKIRSMVEREISKSIPYWSETLCDSDSFKIHVNNLVQDKVVNFSEKELESVLFSLLKKELMLIELWGAILGFIVGCLQLVIILVTRS